MRQQKSFLSALAVFLGTVIGVGIFALPYIASRAGFPVIFLYFILMGVATFFVHFILGKIALGTAGIHRFPGYVEEYLGQKWEKVALLIIGLGLMGALLSYLIIGGSFLNSFFSPFFGGSEIIYTLIFFGVGSYLIFRGIKSISQIELSLLGIFFIILFLFLIKGLPFIDINNLKSINLNSLVLPYGVILFSLWGTAIIPEVKEMVGGDKKIFKRVVIIGTAIAVLVYLLFVFAILGAGGERTSKEALSGFITEVGNGILRLGFIFGVICCFTSYITLGLTFKKILWYDFGLPPKLSWFITSFLPLGLFLLGLRAFIEIIGLTGALMLGAEGLIIVFLYKTFLKQKFSKEMNPAYYGLAGIFVLGIIFEILYFVW